MKHLITERQHSLTVFIESEKMKTVCQLADHIEDAYPGWVSEVTHNRNTRQGSIIVKKDNEDLLEKIEKLINQWQISQNIG
jgi:hypothetical protein